MKRVSIFAVTNTADGIPKYTARTAEELKKCSAVVTAAGEYESPEVLRKLSQYSDSTAAVSGKGPAAFYKTGAEYALEHYPDAEELVFILDDFFGPFCGFEKLLNDACEKLSSADVWSPAPLCTDDGRKLICPSFFAVRLRNTDHAQIRGLFDCGLKSDSKEDFAASLTDLLSAQGKKAEFLYDVDIPYRSNAFNALEAVKSGFPVLFTETLTDSFRSTLSAAMSANIKDAVEYISRNTDYDTELIWEYAIKNTDPFELLSAMGNHFIISESCRSGIVKRADTVMVFHAYYDDLMDENLARLNETARVCDVIITTTSEEKRELILKKLRCFENLSENNTRVLVSIGSGRDMAGLLAEARPYLSGYKYIGFTHDKKSAHHQQLSGETFKEIITENIIPSAGYVENVISLFEGSSRLGLLVPPPPEHGRYFAVIGRRWCENFEYYEQLCRKLGIPVSASPDSSPFALGTAFWCRYDAMKGLFGYDWKHCDFPPEPLPLNGSISHALERCFPYEAKRNGYFSGVIYTEKMAAQYLNMREYMLTDLMTLMNSRISSESNDLVSYEKKVAAALKEHKRHSTVSSPAQNYKAHAISRRLMRSLGRRRYADMINRNRSARILVILHLFYMESWKEIKEYLKNLDPYGYDLIISYTADHYDKAVLEEIRAFKPDAVLKEFPNLGYDVGAFTELLSETDLSAYDIVFKLQSKGVKRPKIYIYGNYLKRRDWFLNLFEGCIGPLTVHKTIDRLMNDPKTGLVAAGNLIVEDPPHKQNMVKAFMQEQGIPIPDKYLFVAGTCFAARAELMQPIADMHLRVSDYSQAGNGFSLAHKMERLLCLTVLNGGYDFYGNSVLPLRRALRKLSPDYHRRKKYSALRLLDDKRFSLDDEFVYFSLEQCLVKKYELVDVPLKDIRRRWINEDIPLKECLPYKYLVSGDPEVYAEYCRQNKAQYGLDIMSREKFDELIRSIEEKGFDSREVIVINSDNVLLDGQHRCCCMLYKYGEDYRIPCLKIYEKPAFVNSVIRYLKEHLPEEKLTLLKAVYHRFF